MVTTVVLLDGTCDPCKPLPKGGRMWSCDSGNYDIQAGSID